MSHQDIVCCFMSQGSGFAIPVIVYTPQQPELSLRNSQQASNSINLQYAQHVISSVGLTTTSLPGIHPY